MTALSENELDRLEALLDSEFLGGEAMLLDEIQGFFCAMLSGPEPIQPAQWLPEVLGPAAIWWAMPVTELLVACYAVSAMWRATRALPSC